MPTPSPTDLPEADGTAAWDSTTLVVVFVQAGGLEGVGYTYADASAALVVAGKLASVVRGASALDPPRAWQALQRAMRNLGRAGLCAAAISAVDTALWNLKAKLLGLPLASLLGCYRSSVEIYGSGGFTSYDDRQLSTQLAEWVGQDVCRAVKIGAEPERGRPPHVAGDRAVCP